MKNYHFPATPVLAQKQRKLLISIHSKLLEAYGNAHNQDEGNAINAVYDLFSRTLCAIAEDRE